MWLSTFTTRHGNICLRFGSRGLNVQACAAGKAIVDLIRKHPKASGAIGIFLPILIQLYFASREYNENSPPKNRSLKE